MLRFRSLGPGKLRPLGRNSGAPNGGLTVDGLLPSEVISANVTVPLVGQVSTSAVGTLLIGVADVLSGVAVATTQGTITVNIDSGLTIGLSGLDSTTQQGTIGIGSSLPAAGIAVSAAQGTLVKGIALPALTGFSTATQQGVLVLGLSDPLVGASSATQQGTFAQSHDVVFAGQESATQQGALALSDGLILAGQVTTTAQGTMGVNIAGSGLDIQLTGAVSATQQGTLGITLDSTVVLTGHVVTANQGTFQSNRTIALTGQQTTTHHGALVRVVECSLDYVLGGYVDGGYVCATGYVLLTATEAQMLADIWRRLGLDAASPLTESNDSAVFGGVTLTKTGTTSITSSRSGTGSVAPAGQALLDLYRRFGLDPAVPMTVTETQIIAGSMVQNVATVGAITTVTRI